MRSIILVGLIILNSYYSLDYKKNTNILASEKSETENIKEPKTISELRSFVGSQNAIVLFHAHWCGHCREFVPIFYEASKYKLASNFEFVSVNCHYKHLCQHYRVNRFPTTKVIINGNEIETFVPRNLESFLEFIEKLSSQAIISVNSSNITHFSNDYGDVPFLVIEDDEESEFFKCIQTLSNNDYVSNLYFGHLKQNSFVTKSNKIIKSPGLLAIGSNENYDFSLNQTDLKCKDIKKFIEINKFPLVKKLAQNYFYKIQNEKKIVFSLALSQENDDHLNMIKNTFVKLALENRNYIFTYIDYTEEIQLVQHLGINIRPEPTLFIFNFDNFRSHVEDHKINTEEDNTEYFKEVLRKIDSGEIKIVDNFYEKIFNFFGLDTEDNLLFTIIFAVGVFGILALIIFCCCCFETKDEDPFLDSETEKTEKEKKSLLEKKNQ